jgi:hypothetical protein
MYGGRRPALHEEFLLKAAGFARLILWKPILMKLTSMKSGEGQCDEAGN